MIVVSRDSASLLVTVLGAFPDCFVCCVLDKSCLASAMGKAVEVGFRTRLDFLDGSAGLTSLAGGDADLAWLVAEVSRFTTFRALLRGDGFEAGAASSSSVFMADRALRFLLFASWRRTNCR